MSAELRHPYIRYTPSIPESARMHCLSLQPSPFPSILHMPSCLRRPSCLSNGKAPWSEALMRISLQAQAWGSTCVIDDIFTRDSNCGPVFCDNLIDIRFQF